MKFQYLAVRRNKRFAGGMKTGNKDYSKIENKNALTNTSLIDF